jgi:hypothetical protein
MIDLSKAEKGDQFVTIDGRMVTLTGGPDKDGDYTIHDGRQTFFYRWNGLFVGEEDNPDYPCHLRARVVELKAERTPKTAVFDEWE